jgi:hypothetical protein
VANGVTLGRKLTLTPHQRRALPQCEPLDDFEAVAMTEGRIKSHFGKTAWAVIPRRREREGEMRYILVFLSWMVAICAIAQAQTPSQDEILRRRYEQNVPVGELFGGLCKALLI